tara:strand:+ start:489 stop:785 length:297 start_codon:yes stop_codon:yes gene_type:complete
MKKIKGKTYEFCDVIIGKRITVAVISSEDDEYGTEAKSMICKFIPEVQALGLPSADYKNEIEGDFEKEIDNYKQTLAGGCGFEYLLIKDENGEIKDLA